MDLSEQPFEALVFKYLSFSFTTTIVSSFFTWVAVITAAFSFWRIRAVGSTSQPPLSFHHQPILDGSRESSSSELTSSADQWVVEEEESEEPSIANAWTSSLISSAVNEDDGTVKGKFTAYYVTDGDVKEEEDDEMTEVGNWGDGEVDGVWGFDDWVAKRTRDSGWYLYQDLTVINGNVVRLWDGVSGRRGSPLR